MFKTPGEIKNVARGEILPVVKEGDKGGRAGKEYKALTKRFQNK